MSDTNEGLNLDSDGDPSGHAEGASNIFLDMSETDSTGIPSLKQAPVSAISASASDSKLNMQMVIAMCVLAIGGGAIYGMRYIGMQAGLDENIVAIDYTSQANSKDFTNRFKSVLRTLDKSTVSVQFTDTESFAEQPFSRPGGVKEEVVEMDPGLSQAERDALRKERERKLAMEQRRDNVVGEAMRFDLQGVIGGARPAARISGQPVRAGMKLGDFFTVVKIMDRSVIIEADGMKFELAIGQKTVQLD